MNRAYVETPQYIEYMLTKPLWLKGTDEYNQHLGKISPISWDEEGQVEPFKPNQFDKLDEFGEEFNWDVYNLLVMGEYKFLESHKDEPKLERLDLRSNEEIEL